MTQIHFIFESPVIVDINNLYIIEKHNSNIKINTRQSVYTSIQFVESFDKQRLIYISYTYKET